MTQRKFQFGISTMLGVTALVAVVVSFWPGTLPVRVRVPLVVMYALFCVSLLLAFLAWRAYRTHAAHSATNGHDRSLEKLSLFCGLLAMAIYSPVGALPYFMDRFEVARIAGHRLLMAFGAFAIIMYVPIMLALAGTLVLFPGLRQNFPLFLLRVLGLFTNLVVLPWFVLAFPQ